jgi:hypothetical protein
LSSSLFNTSKPQNQPLKIKNKTILIEHSKK